MGAWLEFDGPSDYGSDLRSEVGYVRTTNGQASRAEWVEVERCASPFSFSLACAPLAPPAHRGRQEWRAADHDARSVSRA